MMIAGYAPGTDVKWNQDGTLTTGMIERVIYKSGIADIDGEMFDVQIEGNTPSYIVKNSDGELLILPHSEIMTEHTNVHT